ncbi:hypothetical protein BHM03_00062681, partial [Ensete ventricosum]
MRLASESAEQALAGSGPCALARPWSPRYEVGESVRMCSDSELGLGGRLLKWWSPGEEGVLQFGSAKKKKKRRNRTSIVAARSHPRAVSARTRERFFSRTRRRNVSLRGKKDRGDVAERFFSRARRRNISLRGEKDRGD